MDLIYQWPPSKVARYVAYSEVDGPFWHVRGDIQSAQICQHLLAAEGHKATLADCCLDWSPPEPTYLEWKDVFGYLTA